MSYGSCYGIPFRFGSGVLSPADKAFIKQWIYDLAPDGLTYLDKANEPQLDPPINVGVKTALFPGSLSFASTNYIPTGDVVWELEIKFNSSGLQLNGAYSSASKQIEIGVSGGNIYAAFGDQTLALSPVSIGTKYKLKVDQTGFYRDTGSGYVLTEWTSAPVWEDLLTVVMYLGARGAAGNFPVDGIIYSSRLTQDGLTIFDYNCSEGYGNIFYNTTGVSLYDATLTNITWGLEDEIGSDNLLSGFTKYTDETSVSITNYYNNAVCGFAHSIDDYKLTNVAPFMEAILRGTENDIITTVAAYGSAELQDQNSIDTLQAQIDAGNATVASHSTNQFNFSECIPSDVPFLETTVRLSKEYLESVFSLPTYSTYGGNQNLNSWVQSYGTATALDPEDLTDYQGIITDHVIDNGYLTDFATALGGDSPDTDIWAAYDVNNTDFFNRIVRWNIEGVRGINSVFDSIYSGGGIINFYGHPQTSGGADYSVGGAIDLLLQYCGGRSDVWYGTMEQMYLYRYLCCVFSPSITEVDYTTHYEVTIDATSSEQERVKFGLSYPLTYCCRPPAGKTITAVSYKEDGGTYAPMALKVDADVFNGIDAYRIDGVDGNAYVSQSLPQTKNIMLIKVEYV